MFDLYNHVVSGGYRFHDMMLETLVKLLGQRGRIRREAGTFMHPFGRPETTITVPAHARTNRAAPGTCHWPEAGDTLGDHHADVPPAFAFDAHTVGR